MPYGLVSMVVRQCCCDFRELNEFVDPVDLDHGQSRGDVENKSSPI
jgi:hypothetical protein